MSWPWLWGRSRSTEEWSGDPLVQHEHPQDLSEGPEEDPDPFEDHIHWLDTSMPEPTMDLIFVPDVAPSSSFEWSMASPNSQLWLRDCLPNGHIGGFEYDSRNVTSMKSLVSIKRLTTHARNLIRYAVLDEPAGARNKQVILVGHGYGGLICEQAAMLANIEPTEFRPIESKAPIRGMILLNTPHFRAGLAEWAILSARTLKIQCGETAQKQDWSTLRQQLIDIADMQACFQDGFLTGLNKELRMACCFATSPDPKTKLTISPEWCILPGIRTIGIETSHFDMLKFEDPSNRTFAIVRHLIDRWSKKETTSSRPMQEIYAQHTTVSAGRAYERSPGFADQTDELKTKSELVTNIMQAIQGVPMEMFFKNKPGFVEELAMKAASVAKDPSTVICKEELLFKTIQVTMHQQVLYCDDSSSMRNGHRGENRWDIQNQLINRIARITTRILPQGEGVYIRYINQETPNSDSLEYTSLLDIINTLEPNGDTPIGTNLRSKVLEPLVYSKLESGLRRPLLISVITDGAPSTSIESKSSFVDAIAECGDRLIDAGYPRTSVKFMIGRIGLAKAATEFLQDVRSDPRIADVVFVASEGLDISFSRLDSDWKMDTWIIETLYAPIMKSEFKGK